MSNAFPPQPPGNLLPPFPGSTADTGKGPFASSSLEGWADLRSAVNSHLPTAQRNTLAYIVAARRELTRVHRRRR